MSAARQEVHGRRAAAGPVCPACRARLSADAQRCASCGFTGGDTMAVFSDPAPPLMPLLDAAGIWNHADVRKIEAASHKLHRRYPQFRWHVCSVVLPRGTSLPLFGFWMLNVCPFYIHETARERAWAVLLLLDAGSGQAAVIPGYSAERWLGDEDWRKILATMAGPWKAGQAGAAVLRFFETASRFLDQSWKHGGRRHTRTPGS